MLAESPELRRLDDPVVVSTPRGGVPVAIEIARELHAPLDVMPVEDLSTPGKPEYVVGAVAENAIHVIDSDALTALGVTEDGLAQRVAEATAHVARLAKIYRGAEGGAFAVAGRTVAVVDDGSSTAPALEAVALALARRNASELVLVTPLAPDSGVTGYTSVIALHRGEELAEIGLWYDESAPPSDEVAAAAFRTRTANYG
ncbi:MAG: phosphoribosyltransferase [Actinobacteria bacterium]|nr:phosphoribosyltransferase [Actinomycetota bacterium]